MTADMADLRTRFLDRCVGDLARIDRHVALGAWDADELRRLVHSLAGAGAKGGVAGQAVQKPMASGAGRVAVAYAAYSAWISGQPGS